MKISTTERMKLAEDYFMQGYNCSQSVVAAFADVYGYTLEQALRLSAGFGGGIGRMRLTCGAVCGMTILAGMHCGSTSLGDTAGKSDCYRVVQELAAKFEAEHGSIVCAELLKIKRDTPLTFQASERTAEYYRKRPCVKQVISAAKIFAEFLNES